MVGTRWERIKERKRRELVKKNTSLVQMQKWLQEFKTNLPRKKDELKFTNDQEMAAVADLGWCLEVPLHEFAWWAQLLLAVSGVANQKIPDMFPLPCQQAPEVPIEWPTHFDPDVGVESEDENIEYVSDDDPRYAHLDSSTPSPRSSAAMR